MKHKQIRLWDLPTRLCHWLLALGVIAAVVSGQIGGNLMEWHSRIGLLIIGLIVFRLAWGLFGSTYARFAHFYPTPGKVAAYVKGEWRGVGHNPLGALSVFGLLGLVTLQVVTGLFANDDIAFVGPLSDLVDRNLSNRLTGLHHLAANLLYVLVGLHLVAIAFYLHIKKVNLIRPMVTGWKEAEHGEHAEGGGGLALLLSLALAGCAMYGASGVWLPEPPPPPAAETPNW